LGGGLTIFFGGGERGGEGGRATELKGGDTIVEEMSKTGNENECMGWAEMQR
jgi:hypothetical protein